LHVEVVQRGYFEDVALEGVCVGGAWVGIGLLELVVVETLAQLGQVGDYVDLLGLGGDFLLVVDRLVRVGVPL